MGKFYEKKVSVGSFLKKGDDIKDGDLIEIANEGKQVEGQYGTQDVFMFKTKDSKEGNVSVNQTSINGFVDAFGKDATNWIGKQVKVWKIKQNVSGKFIDVYYFSHPEAKLTEEGFVMPNSHKEIQSEDNQDEEIESKDIPF